MDGLSITQGVPYTTSYSYSWKYYFTITFQPIGFFTYFTINVYLVPLGDTVENPYYLTWENGALSSFPTIEYSSGTQPEDRFLWRILPDSNSYSNIGNVNCQISNMPGDLFLDGNLNLVPAPFTEYPWRFMVDSSHPN